MFEKAKQESLHEKQQLYVRAEIEKLVAAGNFLYTPVLSEDDRWRTLALYALDDVTNDQGRLVYGSNFVRLPDVRLVVVNPVADRSALRTGTIRYKATVTRVIPGTLDMPERVSVWKDAGTDATLPHEIARQILVREGFPIVDRRSKGGRRGNVVEFKWLEREAQSTDAVDDIKSVWEQVQAHLTEPKKAPSKNPREAQPSLP